MTSRRGGVVGCIFARGGSKGVPGKNLEKVGGLTLVARAVDAAKRSGVIDRIIISTDDERIAGSAAQAGAEVPFMRPAELARDDSPEWLAWQHALEWWRAHEDPNVEVFCSLPPTAPLRAPEDVVRCVTRLRESDDDIVITVTAAARHPSFNMVKLTDGRARLVDPPTSALFRRQDAAPVYDITTVCYAARPDFVARARSIFDGRVGAVVVPQERALDIDTPFDLAVARCLAETAWTA